MGGSDLHEDFLASGSILLCWKLSHRTSALFKNKINVPLGSSNKDLFGKFFFLFLLQFLCCNKRKVPRVARVMKPTKITSSTPSSLEKKR